MNEHVPLIELGGILYIDMLVYKRVRMFIGLHGISIDPLANFSTRLLEGMVFPNFFFRGKLKVASSLAVDLFRGFKWMVHLYDSQEIKPTMKAE